MNVDRILEASKGRQYQKRYIRFKGDGDPWTGSVLDTTGMVRVNGREFEKVTRQHEHEWKEHSYEDGGRHYNTFHDKHGALQAYSIYDMRGINASYGHWVHERWTRSGLARTVR